MSLETDITIVNHYQSSGSGNTVSIDITGNSGNAMVIVICVLGTATLATDAGSASFANLPSTSFRSGGATRDISYMLFAKNATGSETTVTFDNSSNGGEWFATAYEATGVHQTPTNSGVVTVGGVTAPGAPGTTALKTYEQAAAGVGGLRIHFTAFNTSVDPTNLTGTLDWYGTATGVRANSRGIRTGSTIELWEGEKKVGGPETPALDDFYGPRLPLDGTTNPVDSQYGYSIQWDFQSSLPQTDTVADTLDGSGGVIVSSGTFSAATVGAAYFYVQTSATAPSTAVIESGSGALYHGTETFDDATSVDHNITRGNAGGLSDETLYYVFVMQKAYSIRSTQVRNNQFEWPLAGKTVTAATSANTLTTPQADIRRSIFYVTFTDVQPSSFNDGTANIVATFSLVSPATLASAKLYLGRTEQTITSRTANTLTFTCVAGDETEGAAKLQVTDYL